jgi:hypothetical protein
MFSLQFDYFLNIEVSPISSKGALRGKLLFKLRTTDFKLTLHHTINFITNIRSNYKTEKNYLLLFKTESTLAELIGRFDGLSELLVHHFLFFINFMIHSDHGIIDIYVLFRAGHQQVYFMPLRQRMRLFFGHFFVFLVCFVWQDYYGDVFDREGFYLLHPDLNWIEWVFIFHAVHQKNAHCRSIIRRRESPEALLSGRIPYLNENILSVDIHNPLAVLKANSGFLLGRIFAVAKAFHDGSFADTSIPH